MTERLKALWAFLWGKGQGVTILLLVTVIVGLLLIFGGYHFESTLPMLAKALNSSGGAVLGGAFVGLLTRTETWMNAANMVMQDLAKRFEGPLRAVLNLGVNEVVWFDEPIPWKIWLADCKKFEVALISARTLFTQDSRAIIEQFLSRPDTQLVVVLINPGDAALMEFYEKAFNELPGTRARKTEEAMREAKAIATNVGASARLQLRIAKKPMHCALYRFDGHRVLFTPIWSKPGRAPQRIPGLMFGEGDMVRKALRDELDFIVSDDGSDRAP